MGRICPGGMSMKKIKNAAWLHGALLAAAAVFLALGLLTEEGKAPALPVPALEPSLSPAVDAAKKSEKAAAGCEIIQTMAFARCGHSVTRRIEIPQDLIGADFAAVQQRYDLWRVESFVPERIEMSRELPLFCPIHTVLGVNEAGMVVLSSNMYGDGMAVLRECSRSLEEFAPDEQSQLLLGLGFDSQEEALSWLSLH